MKLIGAVLLVGLFAGALTAQGTDSVPAADTVTNGSLREGTLSQNEISIRLRDEEIELRFVPLDPRLLELLAPDGRRALQGMLSGQSLAIDSAARASGLASPGLALVSFFGQRAGVRFDPQLVIVDARGRLFRPVTIVPLSSDFSAGQLDARQSVMAIYLYEEPLPVWEPFRLTYASLGSNIWESRVSLLERERTRIGRVR